ncbi:hypothetical protein H6P81_013326 [Aristolochia fimbriata]|uniref:Retrovirus-related Pol polyprotein from transposon RE1 n=1 Tax=Aristolochia fimbriata TaxID=158543 RepID=A0AAV7EJ26_ARIFI|nr:hypothetical protein H6P81_013326 [Aristolochia fimbriata]
MISKALSGLGHGTSSASALSAHSGKYSSIIDFGASCHISSDLSLFVSTSSSASASFSPICTSDGSQLSVSSVGSICTPSGIRLSDVLYVPKLSWNLISVGQLCDLGFHVLFTSSGCQVQDPTSGKVLGTGRKVGRLFELEALDSLSRFPLNYSFTASYDSAFTLWHSRLGHVSSRTLLKLISNGHLGSVSSSPLNCVSCKLGKHTALSFNSSDTCASAPFDLIHSDIWGPAPISTMDGSIDRYKARLVAKGYTQEYGIDYEETFAPVARLTSVRLLIALAAVRQWDLFQMDVKNAFLNGTIAEEVYMKPPPGYSHLPGQVCKLRRALYGLKQAPRAWFSMFCSKIVEFGYTQSSHDSVLFTRCSSRGMVLLLLYVDDMVITGDDRSGISDLKAYLSSCFEMKDLGPLRYFLGLEVLPLSGGYGISQVKYASDLVNRAGLLDNKTSDTPLELNVKFRPSDGELLADPTLYRQLLLGRYIMLRLFSILRYVKGTLMQGLFMSSASPLTLLAFSDADWAGDVTDRRSTTGYSVFLGYSPISWRSKKQSTISRSSTEAEYRALADTTSEIVWLRWLLQDMGVHLDSSSPLYCDNKSAMQIAHNAVFHERTKHIEVDCHFVRHHCALGTVDLLYVPSEDQVADLFTKSLTRSRLGYLCSKLKLCSFDPS